MQPYFRDRQLTSDGSAIVTLADDRVEPGWVLVVRTIAANHDNIATTEHVIFRLQSGGRVINIGDASPPVAGGFATWSGLLPVSEGWAVEASYPAAANTEVMRLDVAGFLCRAGYWWSER